jgi:hypothetical protein
MSDKFFDLKVTLNHVTSSYGSMSIGKGGACVYVVGLGGQTICEEVVGILNSGGKAHVLMTAEAKPENPFLSHLLNTMKLPGYDQRIVTYRSLEQIVTHLLGNRLTNAVVEVYSYGSNRYKGDSKQVFVLREDDMHAPRYDNLNPMHQHSYRPSFVRAAMKRIIEAPTSMIVAAYAKVATNEQLWQLVYTFSAPHVVDTPIDPEGESVLRMYKSVEEVIRYFYTRDSFLATHEQSVQTSQTE